MKIFLIMMKIFLIMMIITKVINIIDMVVDTIYYKQQTKNMIEKYEAYILAKKD